MLTIHAAIPRAIKAFQAIWAANTRVIKGIGYLSFIRVVQIGLGLVTTYFLARALSVEQYGEYQFVLNIISILTVFTFTELNNTLMQSTARGFKGSYRKIFPYPLIGSLAGSFALVLFALWYGVQKDHTDLMACFLIAAVFFPFMQGLILWRGLKIGEQKFGHFSFLEFINLCMTQLMIIAVIHFYGGQYIWVLLIFVAVPALLNIIMTWRLRGLMRVDDPPEDGIILHGLKSSFYVSFSTASNYIDKILVFFFLSPAALALFVAADRFADLLRTGVQDVITALAPRFAETKYYSDRLHRFFIIFYVVYGICLMIFAFTVLPHILLLIYGEPYRAAIPYAQALVFSAALGTLASMQFRYIRSKLDTKNFRNIMVWTSLARIGMSLAIIPFFGMTGAVVSAILYRLMLTITINRVIATDYRQGV